MSREEAKRSPGDQRRDNGETPLEGAEASWHRILVLLVFFALPASAVMIWFTTTNAAEDVRRADAQRLGAVTSAVASHLDGLELEKLIDEHERGEIESWPEDGGSLDQMRRKLVDAVEANQLPNPLEILALRPAFVQRVRLDPMKVHPGAMMVLVSSEETPDWKAPRDYIPGMGRTLLFKRVSSSEQHRNHAGDVLSSYASVQDSNGRVVGMVAIDSSYGERLARLRTRVLWPIVAWVSFGLPLIGVLWLRGRSYRQQARELDELAAIVALISDPICLIDDQGRIRWANKAFHRFFGDSHLDQRLDVVLQPDNERRSSRLSRCIETEGIFDDELWVHRSEDRWIRAGLEITRVARSHGSRNRYCHVRIRASRRAGDLEKRSGEVDLVGLHREG